MNSNFDKSTFCLQPWTSFRIQANQRYSPCLAIDSGFKANQALNIEESWLSLNFGNLRYQFLSGQKPDPCLACFNSEKFIRSERIKYLEDSSIEKPATIEQLSTLTSPENLIVDFSNEGTIVFNKINLEIIEKWIPKLKRVHLKGQNLFVHPHLESLILLIFKLNRHENIQLIIESEFFNYQPNIKFLLNQFPKLSFVYNNHIPKDSLGVINIKRVLETMSLLVQSDFPRAEVICKLLVNWFTISTLAENAIEIFKRIPSIKFNLNITLSPYDFSIVNLPAKAKSEAAYNIRNLSIGIPQIVKEKYDREILDYLNLQADAMLTKKSAEAFIQKKDLLVQDSKDFINLILAS